MQIEVDEYQKKLENKMNELKNSQQANGVESCLKCQKVIGCEIRNSYVIAVYNSMNKGKSGDFEF